MNPILDEPRHSRGLNLSIIWLVIACCGVLSAVGGVLAGHEGMKIFMVFFGGLMVGAGLMCIVVNRTIWGEWFP